MPSQWIALALQRLDQFVASQEPSISRSRVQKMIESGEVEVNGEEVTKPSFMLKSGDSVFLTAEWDAPEQAARVTAFDLRLPVLYEDDDCLVIDKPAGIAVHPGCGMSSDEKTILHGTSHLFTERSIPFFENAALVHRLDRETTGCLLVAKNPTAHALLQEQFEHREVRKHYLAVVADIPEKHHATIDAPIGRNLTDRTRMSILRTSVSREAKTTYRTLDIGSDVALLECTPHTGRTHQVRVHLNSIGHPILGDTTYSSKRSEEIAKKYEIQGLCLHARKLQFLSPTKLKEISVEAPLPVSFVSALHVCGLSLES